MFQLVPSILLLIVDYYLFFKINTGVRTSAFSGPDLHRSPPIEY